jgi:hypothetical protein
MKKIIVTFILGLLTLNAVSQRLYTVPYYDWSNHTAFMLSPSPLISGYGYFSDSLSKAHPDTTFYEYGGEYYPIMSWADYYFWYVRKFWYQFNEPSIYEFYYITGNDYGMAQYICGNYFEGYMYPSRIVVSFPNKFVEVNNLSHYYVRQFLKEDKKGGYASVIRRENEYAETEGIKERRLAHSNEVGNSSDRTDQADKKRESNPYREIVAREGRYGGLPVIKESWNIEQVRNNNNRSENYNRSEIIGTNSNQSTGVSNYTTNEHRDSNTSSGSNNQRSNGTSTVSGNNSQDNNRNNSNGNRSDGGSKTKTD